MNVGDKVHWTKISKSRLTITMRHVEGEIVAIDGNVATVKHGRNNRRDTVNLADLRPMASKGQLTEFVEAVVSENKTR